MAKALENILRHAPSIYLTAGELDLQFKGTADSRYSAVKRLLAQKKLIQVRRGLYCITPQMGNFSSPHPFELAHRIYAPSYISFESALAYHQLIPEAVYTVTSAAIKRSKNFHTPFGVYSYFHLPCENFYASVTRINENGAHFLMATPWKALCDYVFCYKKEWQSLKPLCESLRIDEEDLPILRHEEVEILDSYYQHRRISRFLKGIQRDWGKKS